MKKSRDELDDFIEMLDKQREKTGEGGYEEIMAELLFFIYGRVRNITTFLSILTGFLIATLLSLLSKLG